MPTSPKSKISFFDKFTLWKFSAIRTELFSNAVFAISITLLILEIKIPHLHNVAESEELLDALAELAPKIVSWFVCFFFIAVMWVQHHSIMHMADTSSHIKAPRIFVSNF